MKKLKPSQVQSVCIALLFIGAILGFWGSMANYEPAMIFASLVLVGSMIFRYAFYRCPHCRVYLDRTSGPYCPRCGKRIDRS